MPQKIKILVVDDHAIVRAGTRKLLEENPRFQVVGESDGQNLPTTLEKTQANIVLLDINLPGTNGLQWLEALRPRFPDTRFVLFTAHNERPYLQRAVKLQADGYITKTTPVQELYDLLSQVVTQGPVFSSDIQHELSAPVGPDLTAREAEILALVARGHTNQAIAGMLCLSVKTVDAHLAKLLKKLGLNNRTQLTAYAFEQALV
jgi:DNA-binding NarL/FixJ family response regulator